MYTSHFLILALCIYNEAVICTRWVRAQRQNARSDRCAFLLIVFLLGFYWVSIGFRLIFTRFDVGLGAIGASLAESALNLGMEVVAFDPAISLEAAWKLPGKNVEMLLLKPGFVIEIFGFCTKNVRFCIEHVGFCR